MIYIYRCLTLLLAPLLGIYLRYRCWQNKEDKTRIRERFGVASLPRPVGHLIHIHAASVGESLAVLPLIAALQKRCADPILVTTGTMTSATLMAKRLPQGCFHQYCPLDVPGWGERFAQYWRPHLSIFIESDLWPNWLKALKEAGASLVLMNARFSPASQKRWQRFPRLARRVLEHFDLIFSQSTEVSDFVAGLGLERPQTFGNMKFSASPLFCDAQLLSALKSDVGNRPLWLAASTHMGEEILCAQAHQKLREKYPNLLTIIVPRHPDRADDIVHDLKDFVICQRSKTPNIPKDCEIYLADTLGELGLFYALSPISFIGGSLVPIGGHNPIEPALFKTAILWGPETFNFKDVCGILQSAAWAVQNSQQLVQILDFLLQNKEIAQSMGERAKLIVETEQGVLDNIIDQLALFIESVPHEESRLLA